LELSTIFNTREHTGPENVILGNVTQVMIRQPQTIFNKRKRSFAKRYIGNVPCSVELAIYNPDTEYFSGAKNKDAFVDLQ
jgi:hypothetical protein